MIKKNIIHEIFSLHYCEMIHLAKILLYDNDEAEDVVQDILKKLMEKDILISDCKMKNYLMIAVRNECINRIKKEIIE